VENINDCAPLIIYYLRDNTFCMNLTLLQYDKAFQGCRDIFIKKFLDYGTAWRVLRPSSLTDQIFIKARRIRTLEEGSENKVGENESGEFQGIVNYAVMALVQLELGPAEERQMDLPRVESLYDAKAIAIRILMEKKNHDYGEAWRDMRVSSLTDLILMKLMRIKQIEDNLGRTLVSEGIDANYMDIANYALFALIKLHEKENV